MWFWYSASGLWDQIVDLSLPCPKTEIVDFCFRQGFANLLASANLRFARRFALACRAFANWKFAQKLCVGEQIYLQIVDLHLYAITFGRAKSFVFQCLGLQWCKKVMANKSMICTPCPKTEIKNQKSTISGFWFLFFCFRLCTFGLQVQIIEKVLHLQIFDLHRSFALVRRAKQSFAYRRWWRTNLLASAPTVQVDLHLYTNALAPPKDCKALLCVCLALKPKFTISVLGMALQVQIFLQIGDLHLHWPKAITFGGEDLHANARPFYKQSD